MRRLTLLAALVIAVAGGVAPVAAEPPRREQQIKAAFLYSFAKFVTWPAESLPEATSPIVIGVLGADPFDGELQRVVSGRKINQHPVLVRSVGAAEAPRVHLLFVASTDEAELARTLGALATRPVLTVGDSPRAAELGVIVDFSLLDDKVRFSLDAAAAKRAGLEVSSQLQKLAIKPHGRP